MIIQLDKIKFHELTREETESGRMYVCPTGEKVPSVTTILDKTKSDEKKEILEQWKNRVGARTAHDTTVAAAGRGTSMHKILEKKILGENYIPGSNLVHKQASRMADKLYSTYISKYLNEVWGSEIGLYYPEIYAGTTDLIGVWDGIPSIIDFKQTNKPKKEEWIDDYKLQLTAYGQSLDKVYGTTITQGIILMCSVDLTPQIFKLTGDDYLKYSEKWWSRVENYYVNHSI